MPAAIVARCPDCAKGLKLKPSAAGKTVKCPACGAAVPVPAAAGDGAPRADDSTTRRNPAKAKRKRSAEPAAAATGSGNSGEIFAGLDLGEFGHESGSQRSLAKQGLPGRVQKGPLTDETEVINNAPKKKEEPPTPLPVVLGIVGGSLAVLGIAGAAVLFLLLGSGPVEPPGELVRYTHPERGKFAIDVPDNWATATEGGGQGGRPAFATFEGPGGEVQIRQSLSGSAIGDIASAGDTQLAPGEELPEELTAIYGQHEAVKGQVESNFSNYSETGGKNFDSKAGEARRSTFTASGALGGAITGYRGTYRIGNDTYTVVMQSSTRDFAVMGPVYEKMLESVGR
ncbi:hypothetical protein [Alienimonas californiensis]|uniref:Uncharacterized protein n=1 Tax=Alienimonas californiensis TaxID=2527989 RepID=A0A517PFH3_9PLAN|nr:hypothetical protein [Alienimonas californiensis]QDT18126.1 hypothetical protein CA12_42660 [Alienimonas californiensis]